jgi:hypothetical protein
MRLENFIMENRKKILGRLRQLEGKDSFEDLDRREYSACHRDRVGWGDWGAWDR